MQCVYKEDHAVSMESVASFPGHPDFSMLHAEKGEGLVRDVTCAVPALFKNEQM